MSQSAVQRFYRYHAYVYDSTRWMILHGRRQAARQLQLRPESRVLEVGCGTGLNFRYVLDHLDPVKGRCLGLDFSADMLNQARKRVAARGWDNVELVQGDATRMRFSRGFDGILFAYSLTMIPDWPTALDRAAEHLNPGGRIVVLDFGGFDRWGWMRPVMRGWLKANHVETGLPVENELRARMPNVSVMTWMGGYNFTAVGWKG